MATDVVTLERLTLNERMTQLIAMMSDIDRDTLKTSAVWLEKASQKVDFRPK